ncbi:MAG: type 1 glutamine amidotransferase domain-containing protein [Bacteriovoracaceae bacterium]|nr:type 1 glutamine amidotransferase domain-containing protein [Bacteriovoracaceae bacterium]
MNKNALIVVTSNDQLGNSGKKTGWYLSEVSHVYWPLINAGFSVDFASPKGGAAPLEKDSFKLDDPENKSFIETLNIKDSLPTTSMRSIDSTKYQVIYFAGGHGTMWDFPDNAEIERVTSSIYENGGIVSAVCHGPSALTSVKLSDGKYLIEGKEVNSFTDKEEREVGKDKIVPFLLESRLRERGGKFQGGNNWSNQVVISERLITGQNPQSASSLGKAIVQTYDRLEKSGTFREGRQEGREARPSL